MSYFLSRRIASAEQNLDGVQNSITALNTSTSTLSGNVSTLEQELVQTGDSLLTSLGLQSALLTAKINTVSGNVSSLETSINAKNASINANISAIQGNVSTLQSGITSLQNTNASINANISAIQGNVSTLQSGITSLQNSQSAMEFNQSLQYGAIDTEISAVKGNVSTLQGNIASINTNYTVKSLTAGTNITTVNSNGNWTISSSGGGGSSITKVNLAFNENFTVGLGARSVFFNLPQSYNMVNYKMRGKIVLNVDALFDYPAIRFNGAGELGNSQALNEQTWNKIYEYNYPDYNGMADTNVDGYLSRDPIFSHMANDSSTQVLLTFEIDLMNSTFREPILSCKGSATYGTKNVGSAPSYRAVNFFERWSTQTSLNSISIDNWNNASSIQYATLDLDIIPIPSFSSV